MCMFSMLLHRTEEHQSLQLPLKARSHFVRTSYQKIQKGSEVPAVHDKDPRMCVRSSRIEYVSVCVCP